MRGLMASSLTCLGLAQGVRQVWGLHALVRRTTGSPTRDGRGVASLGTSTMPAAVSGCAAAPNCSAPCMQADLRCFRGHTLEQWGCAFTHLVFT